MGGAPRAGAASGHVGVSRALPQPPSLPGGWSFPCRRDGHLGPRGAAGLRGPLGHEAGKQRVHARSPRGPRSRLPRRDSHTTTQPPAVSAEPRLRARHDLGAGAAVVKERDTVPPQLTRKPRKYQGDYRCGHCRHRQQAATGAPGAALSEGWPEGPQQGRDTWTKPAGGAGCSRDTLYARRERQGQRFYVPVKRPRGWNRVDQGRPTEVGPQRRELCPHSKRQPTADAPQTPANELRELREPGRHPGHLLTSWPPEPRPRSALCLFPSAAELGPSPRKLPFPEPPTKAPPSGQRALFLPARCRDPVTPPQTPSQQAGSLFPQGLPTQPRARHPASA